MMMDVLDKLENEKGCVQVILASGRTIKGYADVIVWIEDDEDEKGEKLSKAIWFRPYGSDDHIAIMREDVRDYRVLPECAEK